MVDWSLAQPIPDYTKNALAAFQAGQQTAATRNAGNALAVGDQTGAANAFYKGGMVDQGAQVQDRQRQMQRQDVQDGYAANQEQRAQADQGRQDATFKAQQHKAHLETTIQNLGMLRNVRDADPSKFGQAIDGVAGIFDQMAETPEEKAQTQQLVAAVRQNPALLDTVIGEAEKQWQFVNLGDGGVARANLRTGDLTTLREPTPPPIPLDPTKTYIEPGRPPQGGQAPNIQVAEATVLAALPGSVVTSGYRTPEHNREVGGVPDSYHPLNLARDFGIPKGMSSAQAAASVQAALGSGWQVINEGDHVHIEPAKGQGGQRVIQEAKAKPENAPAGYRFNDANNLEFIPGGPADPAVSASPKNLRPIPAPIAKGIVENRQTMAKINAAIAAVQGDPKAMGVKNYIPDAIMQRADPNGVPERAKVADIGSQLIHDRSGAAVTISETPRLKPFVPQTTDSPTTVVAKLKNLASQLEVMNDETEAFYGPDSGYRPVSPPASQRAQPDGGRGQRLTPEQAKNLAPGTPFVGMDGIPRVRH